ncbi:MAG: GTP pyrophosphokinase family protein [Bacteroidales bacterium]|nr:GTP pyrophosphokinase family protein [Bacteroidales bacterium]
MEIDHTRAAYFFDGMTDGFLPEATMKAIRSFLETENLYLSATREIATKLENLNDEFTYGKDRNPIHQIKTRVKTPKSILDKLARRGLELSVRSARENLTDIAGVRVICSYIDDIYLIADLLTSQDDIEVIRISDYIKNPKPNGYRSLHLIVEVPVFLSTGPEPVKVEIQIRTIAMDFWASLEHELSYKFPDEKIEAVTKELKDCADVIASTDIRMQNLYNITINPAS